MCAFLWHRKRNTFPLRLGKRKLRIRLFIVRQFADNLAPSLGGSSVYVVVTELRNSIDATPFTFISSLAVTPSPPSVACKLRIMFPLPSGGRQTTTREKRVESKMGGRANGKNVHFEQYISLSFIAILCGLCVDVFIV